MENNNFKKILKELREEKQLGQIQLGKELGVSHGIISAWENGVHEPTLSNLIAIAKFFGVTIDYLAGLEDY